MFFFFSVFFLLMDYILSYGTIYMELTGLSLSIHPSLFKGVCVGVSTNDQTKIKGKVITIRYIYTAISVISGFS